jgi:hypothetical protein
MKTPQSEPEPRAPRVNGKFQDMLDEGALERLPPSTPEESAYKLNLRAVDFLRSNETDAGRAEPPEKR